jgi:hypothetical protein
MTSDLMHRLLHRRGDHRIEREDSTARDTGVNGRLELTHIGRFILTHPSG